MYSGSGLDVRPLGREDWSDLVALFGTRGDPSWCWCQYFATTGNGYALGEREVRVRRNREALHRQVVAADRPLGVMARSEGEPVGWLALGPRPSYPRLVNDARLRALAGEDLDDAAVWSTTCFVAKVGHRRRGISSALLAGGVDLARRHGATVLEGCPLDPGAMERPPSSASLYHGVRSVFVRAGFTEVGRIAPHRPVLRLVL